MSRSLVMVMNRGQARFSLASLGHVGRLLYVWYVSQLVAAQLCCRARLLDSLAMFKAINARFQSWV